MPTARVPTPTTSGSVSRPRRDSPQGDRARRARQRTLRISGAHALRRTRQAVSPSRLVPPPTAATLTGPYDTAQIQAITPDPVTVAVTRTPIPGREDEFTQGLEELVGAIDSADGTLGVGLFAPGRGGDTWEVVARFADARALRAWERSDARADVLSRLDPVVHSAEVAAAPSPEVFFEAIAATSTRPHLRRAVHDVAWSLPVAFGFTMWVAPAIHADPLPLRVVVSCAVATVLSFVCVQPVRQLLARRKRRKSPLS